MLGDGDGDGEGYPALRGEKDFRSRFGPPKDSLRLLRRCGTSVVVVVVVVLPVPEGVDEHADPNWDPVVAVIPIEPSIEPSISPSTSPSMCVSIGGCMSLDEEGCSNGTMRVLICGIDRWSKEVLIVLLAVLVLSWSSSLQYPSDVARCFNALRTERRCLGDVRRLAERERWGWRL